jgi:ACS family allantoate permease-like MFS transporter
MASANAVPVPEVADVEKDVVVQDAADKTVEPKGKVAEKLLKHSHDADAAMKAFEGMEGQVIHLSEEKSKALLRKIDWHLMPVSFF